MGRSRYTNNGIVVGKAFESFTLEQTNAFKEPDTFDGVKFRTYTVTLGDRLDHLAARFLNDDSYWWMIALLNNLVSPFLTANQKIRIPIDPNEMLERI